MYVKPRTKRTTPTAKQIKAMRKETLRLIEMFQPHAKLAEMINEQLKKSGVPERMQLVPVGRMYAISNWKTQGRIPYHYAVEAVKIPAVQDAGFTINTLRPDVGEGDVV